MLQDAIRIPGAWSPLRRGFLGVLTVGLLSLAAPGSWSAAESVGTAGAVVAKLTASDAEGGERFGAAVAVSGSTALIGAPLDDVVDLDSGSAYIFKRSSGAPETWTEVTRIVPADAQRGALFGAAVDLSGGTALVGAPLAGNGNPSGSAYIFRRLGNFWWQAAKLVAPVSTGGEQFGAAVAISGDLALVGAPFDDQDGFDSGSAFLFHRHKGGSDNWGFVTRLRAPDAAISDNFGLSVALAAEAAVVGAPLADDQGLDSGSAYVFQMGSQSGLMASVTKLTASDGNANDRFGHSVAISRETVVVGAHWDDDNGFNSGTAFVYQRGKEIWQEVAKLTPADGAVGDWFGGAVAISDLRVIAGAELDDDLGSSSGASYTFERDAGGENHWGEVAKLLSPDGEAQDSFGGSVAISSGVAIVGAREDDDGGDGAGSAYVFRFADLSLALSGSCPGPMTLEIHGATALESTVLLASSSPGEAQVQSGSCAGTQLGLESPRIISARAADEDGRIVLQQTARANFCGQLLQVVDGSTCRVSNLAEITE